MGIAGTSRHLPADQEICPQIGEHGNLGVKQSHIDGLALTSALGMSQGGKDPDRRIHAGEQVGNRHANFLRSPSKVVAFAGDTHKPTDTLHGVVVSRSITIGAGLAVARDTAVNKLRAKSSQAWVIQSIPGHVANFEVLDENVAMLRQVPDQGLALCGCDIAGD